MDFALIIGLLLIIFCYNYSMALQASKLSVLGTGLLLASLSLMSRGAFAQKNKKPSTVENIPSMRLIEILGDYRITNPFFIPPDEQQLYGPNQFDGFAKGRTDFKKAMDNAIGKTDDGSRRLQNVHALLDQLKAIKNRSTKLQIISDWVDDAISYDTVKAEKSKKYGGCPR